MNEEEQEDKIKMKKKPYKIVKSKLFKQQENKMPKKDKEELKEILKTIAKDPINAPNSMSVFGKPSPEELKQWMAKTKANTIDLVFEYLHKKDCLNKKGRELAQGFLEKYIQIKK